MSQNFRLNASFHLALVKIDEELAEKVRRQRCACGGRLDRANYPRSPFGLSSSLRSYYQERFSSCCATCRRRTTAPSVRFFGRRRFPAPLFLLMSVLQCGISEQRLKQIQRHFGITLSTSTWKRWRAWWRQTFEKTPFWYQAQGVITPLALPSTATIRYPRILLKVFRGSFEEKWRGLLQFLAPLTAGALRAI